MTCDFTDCIGCGDCSSFMDCSGYGNCGDYKDIDIINLIDLLRKKVPVVIPDWDTDQIVGVMPLEPNCIELTTP